MYIFSLGFLGVDLVLISPGGPAEGEECGTAEATEDSGGGDPEASRPIPVPIGGYKMMGTG